MYALLKKTKQLSKTVIVLATTWKSWVFGIFEKSKL